MMCEACYKHLSVKCLVDRSVSRSDFPERDSLHLPSTALGRAAADCGRLIFPIQICFRRQYFNFFLSEPFVIGAGFPRGAGSTRSMRVLMRGDPHTFIWKRPMNCKLATSFNWIAFLCGTRGASDTKATNQWYHRVSEGTRGYGLSVAITHHDFPIGR